MTLWTIACQAPLAMGILQERLLEWIVITSSGDLPNPGGLNPGLPHCRWIPYHLSHQGSPATSAIPFFAFLGWYLAEGGSVAHWLL